jgi:hypothetical protein
MFGKITKLFNRDGLDIRQNTGSGGQIRPVGTGGDDIADAIRRRHAGAEEHVRDVPSSLGERLQHVPLGKFGGDR